MYRPYAIRPHDGPSLRADVLPHRYIDACETRYTNREAVEVARSIPDEDLVTITPSSFAGAYHSHDTVYEVGLVDSLPAAERDRVVTVLEAEGLGHVTDMGYGKRVVEETDR